jgi:uncharacterized membrane protein (UPF0127 family)
VRAKLSTAYVIFGDGTRIRAEVADTDEARVRGLMFRAALGEHDGMLFVFDRPGRYPFWMKSVRVPLDIIWIDESCRIVWIVDSAPPCTREPCPMYDPPADASFVVEVAGGFVRRHGIAIGQAITIDCEG